MKKKQKQKTPISKKVPHETIFEGESFSLTINALKENAIKRERLVTDQEIAEAIGIDEATYNVYMEMVNAQPPPEVFVALRTAFDEFLPFIYEQVMVRAKFG